MLPISPSHAIESGVAGLFRPVLAAWAIDVMRLRKKRLDRPSTRRGRGGSTTAPLGGRTDQLMLFTRGQARRVLASPLGIVPQRRAA